LVTVASTTSKSMAFPTRRIISTELFELASPELYMTPSRFMPGRNIRTISMCLSRGSMSETPVMLAPGACRFDTSPAPTGSVMALNSIGVSAMWGAFFSAWAQVWALGVAMARIRSGFSPMIWLPICPAVAMLACAL
jgi:hypothetical protein